LPTVSGKKPLGQMLLADVIDDDDPLPSDTARPARRHAADEAGGPLQHALDRVGTECLVGLGPAQVAQPLVGSGAPAGGQ
jgi:hypothetical protein